MGNCIFAGPRSSHGIVPSNVYSKVETLELIDANVGTRHATSKVTTRYFRCIEEIEKTTNGIVNIFNDATQFLREDRDDEFKTTMESLQTRLFDLHQNVTLLFKLSVFKIDFSIRERKDIGKEIMLLVEDLWKTIKDVFEGTEAGLKNIESKIEMLVKKSSDLTTMY